MAMAIKRPSPLAWFAAFLGCAPSFKKARCKKLLRVTMSRIKLLKRRREVQVRQARQDVAQLLQIGGEKCAKSIGTKLDIAWKEESLLSLYIKIADYCQLVKVNLSNIAGQRECPMDLREPIASLCYAAASCGDLPELQELREIFSVKYGKDFVVPPQELQHDYHVNKSFLERLSSKSASDVQKRTLVKDIIAEYKVQCVPVQQETTQQESLPKPAMVSKYEVMRCNMTERSNDGTGQRTKDRESLRQNAIDDRVADVASSREPQYVTHHESNPRSTARRAKKLHRKREASMVHDCSHELNNGNHEFENSRVKQGGGVVEAPKHRPPPHVHNYEAFTGDHDHENQNPKHTPAKQVRGVVEAPYCQPSIHGNDKELFSGDNGYKNHKPKHSRMKHTDRMMEASKSHASVNGHDDEIITGNCGHVMQKSRHASKHSLHGVDKGDARCDATGNGNFAPAQVDVELQEQPKRKVLQLPQRSHGVHLSQPPQRRPPPPPYKA